MSLAGLRTHRFKPTSQTSQAMPSVDRRSSLFTAAGQFRAFTGFPFHLPVNGRTIGIGTLYLEVAIPAISKYCGYLAHVWIITIGSLPLTAEV
jgi:hypothetical protein